MRIGLLGGTFDPIHEGHLELARWAKKVLGLDKVLFIPVYLPPHKAKGELTHFSLRRRMVELALREKGLELCDLELQRRGRSYTVDTLRELKRLNPRDQFFFLVGADYAANLKNWREADELFSGAHFVVAYRPGFRVDHLPHNGIFLEMPPCPVSSSEIREKVARGHSIKGLVPGRVEKFILEQGLYRH